MQYFCGMMRFLEANSYLAIFLLEYQPTQTTILHKTKNSSPPKRQKLAKIHENQQMSSTRPLKIWALPSCRFNPQFARVYLKFQEEHSSKIQMFLLKTRFAFSGMGHFVDFFQLLFFQWLPFQLFGGGTSPPMHLKSRWCWHLRAWRGRYEPFRRWSAVHRSP